MFRLSEIQRQSIKTSLHSEKRINIWWGSVRSSKTWASLIAFIRFTLAYKGNEDLILTGKTERTIERNIIKPLYLLLGDNCRYVKNRGELYICNQLINCIGVNDIQAETKIRGGSFGGAYCDELTLYSQSFLSMLLSRLSTKGAQLFGTTNTDSPYHYLKTDYLDREGLSLNQFKFMLDDNEFIDRKIREEIKKEFVGLWYKRFILAEWCIAEGAVYDMFRDSFIVNKCPFEPEYKLIGIDYGTNNPCVFLLIYAKFIKSKLHYHIAREYYYDSKKHNKQKTDSEYSSDLKDFINNEKIDYIFIDPSAASFKLQLTQDKFFNITDAINDVIDGIRTVSTVMTTNRLTVNEKCENYIKEKYSYSWDKNSQLLGIDKPKKINDHCNDSERYVIHTTEINNVITNLDW
jgi:PBSX family phage terminase large subunit